MQAASLLDGFSFDLFPPFENDLAAPEVDVSRRQVVQALVISTVVVVPDELHSRLIRYSREHRRLQHFRPPKSLTYPMGRTSLMQPSEHRADVCLPCHLQYWPRGF